MKYKVTEFLKHEGVKYHEAGTKNTSEGWVSIRCPYCTDTSNHMGISLDYGNFTCWKCGEKGGYTKLIMKIRDIPYEQARKVVGYYRDGTSVHEPNTERKVVFEADPNWIPIKEGNEHPALRPFIKRRRFSLELVIQEGCWVASEGTYKHRLIMPITKQGKTVGVQGRDMTGKANVPYLNSPNIFDYIYWLDKWAGRKLVITEGIFDSWRVGKGVSIALFSVNFTPEQLRQIVRLHPSEVLIAFDQDAKRKAVQLKYGLEPYFKTRILNIVGDPADMDRSCLAKLIGDVDEQRIDPAKYSRTAPKTNEADIQRSKEVCEHVRYRV